MHVKIRPKHSPNKAQEFMVLVIFASFPAAFASETDGRSITQAQLQSTPGNKRTGRVRPEMVPNMSRANAGEGPYSLRVLGISTFSTEDEKLANM